MIFTIFNHFENGYHTLRRNRGRTILTTLGITIGIASVTCILALSDGVTRMVTDQISSLGGNLAIIRPTLKTDDPNAVANPLGQQSFSTSSLTSKDILSLRAVPNVTRVAPLSSAVATLASGSEVVEDTVVVATTKDLEIISALGLSAGEFLDTSVQYDTAVVGSQLAIDLFGTNKPIGQTFTMRDMTYTVVGVLQSMPMPVNYNGIDFNNAAIIDYESGRPKTGAPWQIQQINIQLSDAALMPTTRTDVSKALTKNHQGEQDFTIVSGRDVSKPTNELFIALTGVMSAIAGISLFVGGIGIMNIMLVGVAERTREIGIRKAVGASNTTIMIQFLVESLMISLLGGITGYFSGYILAFIVSTFLYFAPAFSWETLGTAIAMAVGVGVLFGIYPAIKAARKDTIESLRQYH